MSFITINLETGFPTIEEARQRLLREMQSARTRGVRVLKVLHGWGSSGEGGKLGPAIRKSLRLRVKEGQASLVLPGERFSSDSNEGREFVQRHPGLRKDRDYNRANPGITLVELISSAGLRDANPGSELPNPSTAATEFQRVPQLARTAKDN